MMSDNGNIGSSTVLQQLLAEHYNTEATNTISSNHALGSGQATALYLAKRSPSEPDISLNRSEAHSNSFEVDRQFRVKESRSDAGQRGGQSLPITPRNDSGPAARLDALCRSTLDGPNPQQLNYLHKNFAMKGKKGKDVTTTDWHLSNELLLSHQNPPKHSATLQMLPRPRNTVSLNSRRRGDPDLKFRPPPPTYLEAQIETDETVTSRRVAFPSGTPGASTPYGHDSDVIHGVGSRSFPSMESNQPHDPSRKLGMQLHGHPKSNSGGDEHLYTDKKKKNIQRRGYRNKKNKKDIVRASSFHQRRDGSVHEGSQLQHADQTISQSHSLKHLDRVPSNRIASPLSANHGPLHAKHFSSKSAPSRDSSQEESTVERRRASLHGNLCNLQEVVTTPHVEDPGTCSTPVADYAQISHSQESENIQNHQVMPQTPLVSQATYMRDTTTRYNHPAHGAYYSGMSNHVLVGQNPPCPTTEAASSPHAPLLSALSGHSPPRPPPPPYPTTYGGIEGSDVNEGGAWNPPRPNSLALGNLSKKKNNNGSSLNSPALVSPSGNCFGTPMRGTPFYGNSKDSPYNAQTSQMYVANNPNSSNSPHQRQTSNGSNSHLRRSGSGNNCRDMVNAFSSSSSTTTGNNTPSYHEGPSFPDVGVRSPNCLYNTPPQNNHPQTYSQDNYSTGSSGSGVSKSDSLNSSMSTTSNGGANCMARRRKRNSSSKNSYGNASSSGSSSGSRPNSNDDLTGQLELENENLRIRLEAATEKLRKYESIEMDLSRITQQHQVLQQSANKREKLEVERFQHLTVNLKRVESEKNVLEKKVATLTEQLKTANMTSSKDDVSDVTKDNSLVEAYQAKNRKLAEKERQLEEELEECRERISELTGDLDLVTATLHKTQATVKLLKEKFPQQNDLAWAAQLSESMAALQKIVLQRTKMESELRERLWHRLQQTVRPLNSTSSNDEGISGMETAELPVSSSGIELYNNPEDQLLGTNAEMLSWKQKYLEQNLLQQMRSGGVSTSEGHKKLCKALSKHRHAVSDPGFDKVIIKKDLPCLSGLVIEDKANLTLSRLCKDKQHSKVLGDHVGGTPDEEKLCRNTDTSCQVTSDKSCLNTRTDCACQTPESDWYLGCFPNQSVPLCNKVLEVSRTIPSGCSSQSGHDNKSVGSLVSTDSPSEGYHSQQSSGSPTPSTEKSSLHFLLGGETASQTRDVHSGQFRRNRSADVLTTLDV